MATTNTGATLTAGHRVAQSRLGADVIRAMVDVWAIVDADDMAGTIDRWIPTAARIIVSGHGRSVVLAARYYNAFRVAEVGGVLDAATPSPTIEAARIVAALSATGPAVVGRSLSNGDTPEQAMAKGSVASARAASRLALSGGRRTITESVRVDRRALGVIRTTSASPCHFCAMLAARGPVYQSERVAKFDAHDGCNCNAEPVYDRDTQWPGRAREWAELYDRTARGEPNPINAFRRAFTAPAG